MSDPGPSGARRSAREHAARAGLVLLGLVLTAVALEVGLRVVSAFFSPRALPARDGRQTILTVGDSHTYGVFFEAEESYPGQLAGLLEARFPGEYRVVNVGLPGTNSSEVVTRLPAWLDAQAPSQVVLCVGVNNVWNRSDADAAGGGNEASWLEHLRIVRLFRLLRHRWVAARADAARPEVERQVIGRGDVAVEFRDRETRELLIRHEGSFTTQRPLDESFELLRRDLERIHALTRERGVRLVLLTYAEYPVGGAVTDAQRNHAGVNRVLRRFAREHDLPLVDAASAIAARLAEGAPPDRYFHPDGSHPTPAGYEVIAERLAEVVSARE